MTSAAGTTLEKSGGPEAAAIVFCFLLGASVMSACVGVGVGRAGRSRAGRARGVRGARALWVLVALGATTLPAQVHGAGSAQLLLAARRA